jgi:transcriptional regulator with XRE-family HTH domain
VSKQKNIPRPTYFGANLKHLRQLDGITQKGLAEAVGITRNKIATYEYGVVEPNVITLLAICDYFGVSPASMMSMILEKEYIKEEVSESGDNALQSVIQEQIQEYISHNANMTKIVDGYRSLQTLRGQGSSTSSDNMPDPTNDIVEVLESLLSSNWDWIESLSLTTDQPSVIK